MSDLSKNTIDENITLLLEISDEFIFPEYYPHTNEVMWKILNPFTNYKSDKVVLCSINEGINKALELAIETLTARKENL